MSETKARESWCEVCGAPLPPGGSTCPLCGNTTELSSLLPRGVKAEGRNPSARLPNRRRAILYVLAAVVGVLLFLAAAAVYGAYNGLREREYLELTAIAQHYQRGMQSLQEGDYALAVAEFEYVDRIRPGYGDAAELLEQARQAMLARPSPTSQAREEIAASLFARAQDEMEQGAWSKAIATLQELQRVSPGFRSEQVKALLFQSMYSAGLQALAENDVSVALEWFKQALTVNPDSSDVRRQITLASTYLTAMADWGHNWAATVEGLERLYSLSPGYADVADRLATAYVRYGDQLSSIGEWCSASEHYRRASAISDAAAVNTKAALAESYCQKPPKVITPAVGETATSVTTPTRPASLAWSGTLYFAMTDATSGSLNVYALAPGADEKPRLVVPNGEQAALRDDSSIGYRNLVSDKLGISMAEPDGSFASRVTWHPEDAWPTWESGVGRLAFASTRESDRKWRIYIADNWHLGAEARNIAYGRSPAWGSNGLIAYRGCDATASNCGIYLMNADGVQVSQVTDNPNDEMPAWSSDASKLAFTSPRSGTYSIWVKELKANRLVRLTDDQGFDVAPAWSPDGRYLAFLSNRSGAWGIWVIPAGGGEPVLVFEIGASSRGWDEMRLNWR